MLSNWGRLVIHFIGAAAACALLAYWAIRLMTPPPAPAPAPVRVVLAHDPDPVLIGRAFGEVEHALPEAIGNIQVAGVYAAGRNSAAVFVVGDHAGKAVRLGQEVAPGSRLVEVDSQSVTLESGGVRRQLRVPNPEVASTGPGTGRSAAFERRGNELTAPTMEVPPSTRPVASRSPMTAMPPRFEPRQEFTPVSPGHHDMAPTPTTQ